MGIHRLTLNAQHHKLEKLENKLIEISNVPFLPKAIRENVAGAMSDLLEIQHSQLELMSEIVNALRESGAGGLDHA